MIDRDGFRSNVGIIVCNDRAQLLWARRMGQNAWQFPQGGIEPEETAEDALFRELQEEVGLDPEDVEILAATRDWLRYRLPKRYIRHGQKPLCIGQKQVWFMLRLVGRDEEVRLDRCPHPEFDSWRWVSYWQPVREVVFFKRHVYSQALREFEPILFRRRKRRRRNRKRTDIKAVSGDATSRIHQPAVGSPFPPQT